MRSGMKSREAQALSRNGSNTEVFAGDLQDKDNSVFKLMKLETSIPSFLDKLFFLND